MWRNWRFTPGAEYNGNDSFEYYCYDNPPIQDGVQIVDSTSDSSNITVYFHPIVDIAAINLSIQVSEDIPYNFYLDCGPQNNPPEEIWIRGEDKFYSLESALQQDKVRWDLEIGDAPHGKDVVWIGANASSNATVKGEIFQVTYRSNRNYFGSDSFDYTCKLIDNTTQLVLEGQIATATATVNVDVVEQSDSPILLPIQLNRYNNFMYNQDISGEPVDISTSDWSIDSDYGVNYVNITPITGTAGDGLGLIGLQQYESDDITNSTQMMSGTSDIGSTDAMNFTVAPFFDPFAHNGTLPGTTDEGGALLEIDEDGVGYFVVRAFNLSLIHI